jgi:opacity protein-like surface antigen
MNVAEKTTRLGLGLSWQPTKNWTANLSGDLDRVNSEDASRGQSRNRYGLSARYTF